MDNSKTPYMPPSVVCVMLSSQHALAAWSNTNDSLSDFDETTPVWTID